MSNKELLGLPDYSYLSGFGNFHESEVLQGAIPLGQNSPQKVPYGLYAEQLSGSAFTVPRTHNLKTWLYRIQPSVTHTPFKPSTSPTNICKSFGNAECDSTPNQLRWSPYPIPEYDKVDFVAGLHSICGAGDPSLRSGLAIHVYLANSDMTKTAFYNSDGDFLIVPQQGSLDIQTELGRLYVSPNEIVVIPRGISFKVCLTDGPSRGYILETYDRHWELPDLGPIGSNGLANPRHFMYPTAYYEDSKESWTLTTKYQGSLFNASMDHSPFNVVGWSGNYSPFKYDLRLFNTINSVSFDHPDPSIFTVLTVKSANPGEALADFVIFPPKWMVAVHTFRPPYFHRNSMTEFMGLISGTYDAKASGFAPGGASLHSMMTPHGPDSATFEKATNDVLKPVYQDGGIAFMFETSFMMSVSKWALYGEKDARDVEAKRNNALQDGYNGVWQGLKSNFTPSAKG